MRHLITSCFLMMWLSASPVWAQTSPEVERLDWESLKGLLAHSPLLLTREANTKLAESALLFAKESPNPTLEFNLLTHVAGTDTFDKAQPSVGFSQPLRVVGKAKARREAAQAGLSVNSLEGELLRQQLFLEGRRLLLELSASQAELETLEDLKSALDTLEAHLHKRQTQGVASPYDLKRFTRERLQLHREIELLKLSQVETRHHLSQLVGKPLGNVEVAPTFELSPLPDAAEPALPLALAQARLTQRQLEVRATERERWPDLVLSGGVTMTADEFGLAPYVGLSMDLMLFDKGKAAQAKAEAEALLARKTLHQVETQHQTQVQQWQNQLAMLGQSLQAWEAQLTHDGPLAELAQHAYQAGKADLHEVLDAFASDSEAKRQLIRLGHSYARTQLELWALQGRPLD